MAKINLKNNMQAFPDEETFQKIYDECLDNAPFVSDEVLHAQEKLSDWFEVYVGALDEYTFRYAYQCGYSAAMEEVMQKGGAA